MRILLIEDDEVLTSILIESLQQQRYVVDTVDDGRLGLEYAEGGTYDLLLVDVGLPRLDGISLCQRLRNQGCTTPILLMTAKDAPDEKIHGLDAGADDYLTKPLNIAELHARLRALLRRGEVTPSSVLEIGQLRLDPVACEVTYASNLLKLTPKEYSLLELFLRNPTRVFSRGHIIEHLWTFDDPPLEDSVKAHVKGLRRRLKQAGAEDWIENVYGLGYKLSPKIDYEAYEATDSDPIEKQAKKPFEQQAEHPEVEQAFNQALATLWQQHHSAMIERLSCLKRAKSAVEKGQLNDKLCQSASQAAHKLAGVLGMFGRDDGTETARSLEALLGEPLLLKNNRSNNIETISSLVRQLETILSPAESSSVPQLALEIVASGLPVKILAVDDDPIFLSSLPPLLKPWGMTVTTLSDPAQFWDTLTTTAPDLLMLDIEMPHCNGIELCQAVRNDADSPWQSLPILFLSARQNAAAQVFAAGADDYVVKPVLGPELITRISNRLERTRLLQRLRNRDGQTGLSNQAQAQRYLQQMIKQKQPYTFVLLQLVNLTQINLDYGHSTGHKVLKFWGDELTALLPNTPASYWGNGDFVVGLPAVDQSDAIEALSAVRKSFRQRVFTAPSPSNSGTKNRFQAQYAIGLSTFPNDGKTLIDLYKTAHTMAQQSAS